MISSFVKIIPVPYFSIPFSLYFDNIIYLVVITTSQWLTYLPYHKIPSVSSKLCITCPRPWLLLTHVEKGNYIVLNLKTFDPLSRCSLHMPMVEIPHNNIVPFTHFFDSVIYIFIFFYAYVWTSIN